MSEEPRYLVRNREMLSRLLGIQELRLVVKTQLFDGKVVSASLSPYPTHRGAPLRRMRNDWDLVYAGVNLGSDSDGAQCNGDFVTHPSSTVCSVNLSN